MKKCVSVLLSLLMLLTMMPMGAVAAVSAETVVEPNGPCFVVSATEGKAGDTVTVTVSAKNNPGIISAKVRVGYDPAVLKLVDYAGGDFSESDYSWSEITHNPFIINWCNALDPNSTAEWLATLTFEILSGAAYGATPLTLTVDCDEDVFDYDLVTVPFDVMNGQVYVLYPATGIVLSQNALHVVDGESATLTATAQAAGLTDQTVTWQSSDPSVAFVDANGVVTALKKGTAVITATAAYGGVGASCTVDVACAHAYDAAVTAPDCVNGGYTTYVCTKRGDSYVGDSTDALGHTAIVVAGKEATCTEDGLTDGYRCADCQAVLIAQEIIPATGHTEVVVAGKEATCTEDGLTEGKKCSVCDAILVAQQGISATGHTEIVVAGKDATCTESGLTDGKKCSVCDAILVAQQMIPATGHTAVMVAGKDATCTEDGLTDGYHCSVCDVVLVAQEIISARGHAAFVVAGYDATCTEDGLTEGEKCAVCGVMTIAQQVIPATGHTAFVIAGKDATCTEEGLTDGKQCSVCGEITVVQQVIPATGHTYQAVVTAPTCVSGGYTTYTCACGDSYVGDEVSATGEHTYDDDKDADCNVCGAEREIETVLLGDVDGNGRINNRDLGRLQQYINEWDVTVNTDACDMDENGRINNRDLGRLQQYINEWDVVPE